MSFHQLIPCPSGWFAVYALDPEYAADSGAFERVPLIGWALVEERSYLGGEKFLPTDVTSVVGLCVWSAVSKGSMPNAYPHVVCHDNDLFLGYDHPGCIVDWRDLAAYSQKQIVEEKSR